MHSINRFINDCRKYRHYFWYSTKAELKSSVANSLLGYMWWLLDPLIRMGIYSILFVKIFSMRSEAYPFFLFCALLPWRWVSVSWGRSVGCIAGNAGILKQIYLPKFLLPLQIIVGNFVTMLVGYTIAFIMMWAYGMPFTWHILELPLVWFACFMVIYASSLFFAHIGVLFSDFHNILAHIIQISFYLSPILYGIDRVLRLNNPVYRLFFWLNPFTTIFGSIRNIMMRGNAPLYGPLAVVIGVSFVFMVLGMLMLYSYEKNYTKMI